MRWTPGVAVALAIVAALVAAPVGCGSQITVPDQGVIVTGCQLPSQCYKQTCKCSRADVTAGKCTVACRNTDPNDPSTCDCLPDPVDGGDPIPTQCLEPAMACIGRGVLCPGVGAKCKPSGMSCDGSGDPPQVIPTFGTPMLEPHCQYTDDVCCPGIEDGGVSTD